MEEKSLQAKRKCPLRPKRQSFRRKRQTLIGTLSMTNIVPPKPSLSLVKVKEATRAEFGLAPAPPDNILGSIFDYGLQKYSADSWAAIEMLRIFQELPSVPAWIGLLAGLFGLGAAAQGLVDIRDGLAGYPRPQTMTKFATPEFQLPKGFSLPAPPLQLLPPRF